MFDYHLTDGDYISFIRRKSEQHIEIDELSDMSRKKIKQVCFKVLEQAGIIDNVRTKEIQPMILKKELIQVIVKDDPNWLKVFFVSDLDIMNMAS